MPFSIIKTLDDQEWAKVGNIGKIEWCTTRAADCSPIIADRN